MTSQGGCRQYFLLLLLTWSGHTRGDERCQAWSDVEREGVGSGPTDHWPTVENVEACKLQHCSREMASCLLDPTCLASLTCPAGCTGGDAFVAGLCNYEC